jgi:hypothetical protein
MTLSDALKYINGCNEFNHQRFDIEFITLDKTRGTGGKLKKLTRCRAAGAHHNQSEHGTISVLSPEKSHEVPIHIHLIQKVNGEFIRG